MCEHITETGSSARGACCLSSGPDDIPKGGSTEACGQALFAKDKVEYHGQIVGLIVAKSQVGRSILSALTLTSRLL